MQQIRGIRNESKLLVLLKSFIPVMLTCMAPRFSVNCSGLEVPKRTELTPSFLRHQARNREKDMNRVEASVQKHLCKSYFVHLLKNRRWRNGA